MLVGKRNCLLAALIMLRMAENSPQAFTNDMYSGVQRKSVSKVGNVVPTTSRPQDRSLHLTTESGSGVASVGPDKGMDDADEFLATIEDTDDDDDEDVDVEEVLGEAAASNQKHQPRRKVKPFDGDVRFLRKRTTELLRATHPSVWVGASESSADAGTTNKDSNLIGSKMKIGLKTFNFLIGAWTSSGETDAPDQAMALLRRMEELHRAKTNKLAEDCPFDVSPDARSYTKVINALAKSPSLEDAGAIAESILKRMDSLYQKGKNSASQPNRFTYCAVIEAYANNGEPHAAEHIERLCDTMLEMYENGDTSMQPTTRCFNCAIIAHAKSGQPGAALRAEAVLDRLRALHDSGMTELKPTTATYNSLITAWANSRERLSADSAESVLSQMEAEFQSGNLDCQPTTVSYNAVIDAYAKSGEPGSAQHAEDVLKRMQECEYDTVMYNTRSFNSVMNAWARSREYGAEEKAESLLKCMTKLADEGNILLQPDVRSFSTVISAWGRSQSYGKAQRANELFEDMLALYENGNESVRPNVVAVNAVLNACAYTSAMTDDLGQVMDIAHTRMKELERSNYGSPDQVTYGTFLKVCSNLMEDPDSLEQVAELIFKKCCRDGQLGNLVLQEVKHSATPELFEKLTKKSALHDVAVEELPEEWSRNVVEGKWKRNRRNMR